MQKEYFIESAAQAIESVKDLMRRQATFSCYPVHEETLLVGWMIYVTDEGHPNHADDLRGDPKETINTDFIGRVLAARKARLDEKGKA